MQPGPLVNIAAMFRVILTFLWVPLAKGVKEWDYIAECPLYNTEEPQLYPVPKKKKPQQFQFPDENSAVSQE